MTDDKILAALDERSGKTTGDVAKAVPPRPKFTAYMHGQAIRSRLLQLEALGLVRRLDDQKPVC